MDLQLLRVVWFLSSVSGLVFYAFLSGKAWIDLLIRKRGEGERSAILLGWRALAVNIALLICFIADVGAGVFSVLGPHPEYSLPLLIISNLGRFALGIYLWWVRREIRAAGQDETEEEIKRLRSKPVAGPNVDRDKNIH